jgi:hypothetical protein
MVLAQDLLQLGLDEHIRARDDVVRSFVVHVRGTAAFLQQRHCRAQRDDHGSRLGSQTVQPVRVHRTRMPGWRRNRSGTDRSGDEARPSSTAAGPEARAECGAVSHRIGTVLHNQGRREGANFATVIWGKPCGRS